MELDLHGYGGKFGRDLKILEDDDPRVTTVKQQLPQSNRNHVRGSSDHNEAGPSEADLVWDDFEEGCLRPSTERGHNKAKHQSSSKGKSSGASPPKRQKAGAADGSLAEAGASASSEVDRCMQSTATGIRCDCTQ